MKDAADDDPGGLFGDGGGNVGGALVTGGDRIAYRGAEVVTRGADGPGDERQVIQGVYG